MKTKNHTFQSESVRMKAKGEAIFMDVICLFTSTQCKHNLEHCLSELKKGKRKGTNIC